MSDSLPAKKRLLRAPQLPATAVHARSHLDSKHIVFVRVKVMDQKGDTYYFDAACQRVDLLHPHEIGENDE